LKIINLGILAHVDAGKTTITESMLYKSGVIKSLGRVDNGTAKTDSMAIERQRGITVRASTVSFQWNEIKINIIDTPGHMDFIAEVERSLSVLDAAILVISAKEGVQVQTRLIFRTLQKMKIPTIIFINKIDRLGVCLEKVYEQIKEQLTPNYILMQNVDCKDKDEILIENSELSSARIMNTLLDCDDKLAEKYILDQQIAEQDYCHSLCESVSSCKVFPVYLGSALKNIGIERLLDALTVCLQAKPATDSGELSAYVYKIDQDECMHKRAYLRIYSGCMNIRELVPIEREQSLLKLKSLYAVEKGAMISTEKILSNDIAIILNSNLHVGDVIGHRSAHFSNVSIASPHLQASIIPANQGDRNKLIQALMELSEEDPLLHCTVDKDTDEITINLFGRVQMEVIKGLIEERYHISFEFNDIMTIYKERPRQSSEAVIHMGVMPNPYWASVGLTIEPLPVGSGIVFESKVSYGYLNNSFQTAVKDGVLSACKYGLFGWEVTDLKVCFNYGLYSSPVSTPSDFRHLTPYVLEKALRKAGTELFEPFSDYELQMPKEYSGKAMNDIQLMRGSITEIRTKNDQVILKGKIPSQTSENYQAQVISYTNGLGLFLSEPSGYSAYAGKPIYNPKKEAPDKLKYLFLKDQ